MSDIYQDLDNLIFKETNDNLNIYDDHKDLIKKYLLVNQNYENAKEILEFNIYFIFRCINFSYN